MKTNITDFDILIIDDNVDLANNLKEILEAHNFTVKTVYSGDAAIETCQKNNYFLVLTDINLPDISGIDLVKKLQKITPSMEYIIITGNASLNSAIEAIKNREILSYEQKPLDMERLLNSIKQFFA